MPIATDTPNARTIELVVTIVDQPASTPISCDSATPDKIPSDAAGQRNDRRLDQELADDVALRARRWRGGRRSRACARARWPA